MSNNSQVSEQRQDAQMRLSSGMQAKTLIFVDDRLFNAW